MSLKVSDRNVTGHNAIEMERRQTTSRGMSHIIQYDSLLEILSHRGYTYRKAVIAMSRQECIATNYHVEFNMKHTCILDNKRNVRSF